MTTPAPRSERSPVSRNAFLTFALPVLLAIIAWGSSVEPAAAGPVAKQSSFGPTARIEDDDPNATFTGGWRFASTTAASSGTRRIATGPGAIAKIRFYGTGVALVSRVAPGAGRLAISLDGSASVVVDLSRDTVTERARVWTADGLARRAHSVTVRTIETSPVAEWRTAVVDAFQIEGTALRASAPTVRVRIEESDRRIRFLGRWRNRADLSGASRGRASVANGTGARAIVTFSGTGISWLAPNQGSGARAQVLLDGRSYGYVSTGRAGERGAQRVMWSIGGLRRGRHTLDVRAVRTSAATSRVVADVFEVEGSPADARPVSALGYPWRNYIVIDKSEFRLYLVKNGLVVRTYPVAHGKLGWATPVRVWRVGAKYYTGGVYGPRKMRLFKRVGSSGRYRYVHTAYGIHGTNQPWVIGTRASHGCIRLYNDDVLDLFPRVGLGTMVVTRD